jgi:hypothetical protein
MTGTCTGSTSPVMTWQMARHVRVLPIQPALTCTLFTTESCGRKKPVGVVLAGVQPLYAVPEKGLACKTSGVAHLGYDYTAKPSGVLPYR